MQADAPSNALQQVEARDSQQSGHLQEAALQSRGEAVQNQGVKVPMDAGQTYEQHMQETPNQLAQGEQLQGTLSASLQSATYYSDVSHPIHLLREGSDDWRDETRSRVSGSGMLPCSFWLRPISLGRDSMVQTLLFLRLADNPPSGIGTLPI